MDNKLIGASIASLRQKRSWTQRQLARQLNVSHQAVSKWENGDAAPDVETLVALARLFGVSIDRVINPKPTDLRTSTSLFSRRKVDDFEEEDVDESDEEEDDEEDEEDEEDELQAELEEAQARRDEAQAMLDEAQAERDEAQSARDEFGNVFERHGHHHEFHFAFGDDESQADKKADPKLELLKKIAPFVSREVLDEKFLTYLAKNDLENFGVIEHLAPFVSREVLGRAIDKVIDKQINPQVVLRLAPFIAKKDLARLLATIEDREWVNQNLARLAPFLSREYLDQMLMDMDF